MDDKSKMAKPSVSVTRRQFLQCGTATLFGAGLARTSFAQEAPTPKPQSVVPGVIGKGRNYIGVTTLSQKAPKT